MAMCQRSSALSTSRVAARTAFVSKPVAVRVQRRAVAARAAGGKTIDVTDDKWQEVVLNSDVPVLVDFWAPWCGPCRMIAPLVDEIAEQYSGKAICVKVNTDESPGTATKYGIRSIPTVLIFKTGAKMDTIIGAVPKSTLTDALDKYL